MAERNNTVACFDWDIIQKITGSLLSSVSAIAIVAGLIMGGRYISRIKDRQYEAIFGFFARLSNYLFELNNRLKPTVEKSILLYYYNKESINKVTTITIPGLDELASFKQFIQDFIDFLKKTDNQVPMSTKVLVSFEKLKHKIFSLTDLGKIFPYGIYTESMPLSDECNPLNKERNEIIKLINTLLELIREDQERIMIALEKRK
jgi:hypothetical protein